jgi:dCMP deaminase
MGRRFLKFLPIAQAVAELSKDQSTKVGALIVGPSGEGGPWGYNGAPRGCSADETKSIDRDYKLRVFEHAERNAIYAAARQGFSTKGCSIVVTHYPCCDCARAIIQSGVVIVVCPAPTPEFAARWSESLSVARALFRECGVKVIEVSDDE